MSSSENNPNTTLRVGAREISVPSDWDSVKLRDIIEVSGSGEWGEETESDSNNKRSLVIRSGDITLDGELSTEDIATRYLTERDYDRYGINPLDIVIVSSSGSEKHIGKKWLAPETLRENKYHFTNFLYRIRLDASDCSRRFIYYFLNSDYERTFLESITPTSTGLQNLDTDSYEDLTIPFPPLPEQRRIADILSTVDEQINQTDEIIEETRELKLGLRKDLVLGQGLSENYVDARLGARDVKIPSNWDVKRFSDVATLEKGNTPKTSNDDYYGGDTVWVTPDDLSSMYDRGEKYISDSRRKLTDDGLDSTSVNVVPAPSVMFTSRSYGIGKTAICTIPAATNQGIIAFHPNEEIGTEYLYYYLNHVMDYIIALSGVSTFPEVSLTDVRNLRVPVPPKEDQEHIQNILQTVDERLVEERKTKRHLQELKRGLMQDLLTGKVRVDTEN